MAALSSITAVKPTSNTRFRLVRYGASVSIGNPVYLDSSVSKHKPTDADASAAAAVARGIAVTAGSDGDYGIIAVGGAVELVGASGGKGKTYYAGNTAGQIVENSDLSSSSYVTELGNMESATLFNISIQSLGYTHA